MTLASWIVVALAVVGVVVLGLVAVRLLPKVRRFARAMKGLQARAVEAQQLQAELNALQAKAAEAQVRAASVRMNGSGT